jgi:hypothetical protein
MFLSTWADSAGFNPGWTNSESYHATSNSVLGPYARKGYIWSSGSHHGHNTTAAELLDGTYAVVVSEVVPFTIYKSTSLDGPWTACPAGELIQTNGVNAGTDTHWDSNVSLVARHDGKFQIVQRHGLIAIADTLCGPYLMQKPTWTYPQANRPSIDSIYPHRTSLPDPAITNPTYAWEEDPTIWYSGCRYHVLYSGSGDRIGYELSSPDGIHDWRDGSLAFDPRMYQKIFCYDGSTTCNQWYKMERPGVVLENGHVTHVTWSVADVDKDNSIPGGSNHGSKIIVVPFDGVGFDNDTGACSSGGAGSGGATSTGGASVTGGTKANGGSSTAGGTRTTGGNNATGGAHAVGGSAISAGGSRATGGFAATGGIKATGGVTNAANLGGAPGSTASGGRSSTGGATQGSGGAVAITGGSANAGGGSGTGGAVGTGGTVAVGGTHASGGLIGSTSSSTTDFGTVGTVDSANPGSCSCRVAGRGPNSKSLASLGFLCVLMLRALRRRAGR